jgi:hypothetical protein
VEFNKSPMNQEKWYQVILPGARFQVEAGMLEWLGETEWVVKEADPVAHRMTGIAIQDIRIWAQRQGGSIKELRDSQARIAVTK